MHPRVIATPHAAFYSSESILELQETAASQVASVLIGEMPGDVVNPEVLQAPQLRARSLSLESPSPAAGRTAPACKSRPPDQKPGLAERRIFP
jgi:hypothetical protein